MIKGDRLVHADASVSVRAGVPSPPGPCGQTSDFRRFSRAADLAGTSAACPPQRALTTMTILAAPPVIITTAYPAETTTPPASHTRRGAPAVTTAVTVTTSQTRSCRTQPADIDQTLTGQLLRQRDRLPAGHPDRAAIRARVIEANLPP